MKQKSHSGLKKRIKVKNSGTIRVQKSCKNHLLSNKSKKMKKGFAGGLAVSSAKINALRRLLPGVGKVRKGRPLEMEEVGAEK